MALLQSIRKSIRGRTIASVARALEPTDYILENSFMTKEQREEYEENGYLVVRKLIPEKDIERYRTRFEEYATGRRKPKSPDLTFQKEVSLKDQPLNENSLYKLLELYADEVLFEYCKHPRIMEYAQCFVGSNIMTMSTQIINKPPDPGNKSSRHPLHQDIHYFPMRPINRMVGVWTAMEKVTRDNGCLVVIPGTHKFNHLDHEYPDWEGGVNKYFLGVNIPKEMSDKRLHIHMETGDTMFFHTKLIHGSGMNRTKGFRKAICCHYAPVEAEFIDVNQTNQKKMADEVLETLKRTKLKNIEFDYATLWKIRARNVHGTGGWDI